MPVFSCGGMRYQHRWSDDQWENIPDEAQRNLENTIRRAIDLGINHIETARGYGTSEYQLGKILPDIPRDSMIVQTKVAPNESVKEFEETFETSMSRLGLEYVDLFSLHGMNNHETLDWAVRDGGCIMKALEWKRQGRIRHIGFSTHAPVRVIMDAIRSGYFEYVNLHWYFVNDFNWPAVQLAAEQDMGVFIISPSDKGGKLYEPPDKLVKLCAPLTPMAFNDLYCLARPEVHTLSIGAARPSDFDAHIAALEHYEQAAEIIQPVESRIRSAMESVLGEDWTRHWREGLPEYEQVPGQVNLLEILRLWGCAKALDLVEFAKMRYNLLGNAGHWFPGQKADNADGDAIRNALDGYRFADRIPAILDEAHRMLNADEQKRLSESD